MIGSVADHRVRRAVRRGGLLVMSSLALSHPAVAAGSPAPASTMVAAPGPVGSLSLVGRVGARDANGGRTLTLLPDGRVVTIDGETAQVWDPMSGALSPAGELRSPREWTFTSTLLTDGRVVVVGGVNRRSPGESGAEIESVAGMEIWDPSNGSFTEAGSLQYGRIGHATVQLLDGSLLVVGGQDGEAWLVDAEHRGLDGTLIEIVPFARDMVEGWGPPGVAILADGRILLTGVSSPDRGVPLVTWDPATGHMADLTPVDVPPAAVPMQLPDGHVLILGTGSQVGCDLMGPCSGAAGARVLDPTTDQSTLLFERQEQVTVKVLPDGRVLALWGGTSCDGGPVSGFISERTCVPAPASAEIWDLASATATALGPFPATLKGVGQGALLADGRVLVSVGEELWVVDPTSGSMRPAGALPAGVHADADLVPLPDGRALVVGRGGAVAVWTPAF